MKVLNIWTALFASVVLGGLEKTTHSTELSFDSFKRFVRTQTVGSLVAFYAPWCGHCKTLAPAWDTVAALFEKDERCKLGHLDADNAQNKPIAKDFAVQGFPTIKFIPSDGSEPVSYNEARSEQAILNFLNVHCGTEKDLSGKWSTTSGRISAFDTIVAKFFGTDPAADLIASASSLASSIAGSDKLSADYYLKIMNKIAEDSTKGFEWVNSETKRIGKLLSDTGKITAQKADELNRKVNILTAFENKAAKESSKDEL